MKFRPCIDIHNGKVKQIIGGSLADEGSRAVENFVAEQDAAAFARMYREAGLVGGHIILLNPADSAYYEADCRQAEKALHVYPGGLQIGGGIRADNAERFLRMGASHVIVTSYVFQNGGINREHLDALVHAVGKEHIVLDLSCRKKEDGYYIATERWQHVTDVKLTEETLLELSDCCDEYLVHAVDVEGKASGIEAPVAELLGRLERIPTTYAGGIASFDDLDELNRLGRGRVDFTIGSALDLFGGRMRYQDVIQYRAK